jgi:hypothetical protein
VTGIETIALASMAASAGIGAIGEIQQGYAAKQQAEYNASVAEANAAAARQQAALDESTSRKKSSMLLGTIRARAAANTGDVEGSALDVLADSAAEAELEALVLRYGGEVKARQSESEARLLRQRGKDAVWGGYIGAGTKLLTAAAYGAKAYGAPSAGGSAVPTLSSRVPARNAFGGRAGTGV